MADVDQPWNEWVDALERLASTLLHHVNKDHPISSFAGDLSAQDVLSSVDSRLSEAVLYALENGPLLEKKVSPNFSFFPSLLYWRWAKWCFCFAGHFAKSLSSLSNAP